MELPRPSGGVRCEFSVSLLFALSLFCPACSFSSITEFCPPNRNIRCLSHRDRMNEAIWLFSVRSGFTTSVGTPWVTFPLARGSKLFVNCRKWSAQ